MISDNIMIVYTIILNKITIVTNNKYKITHGHDHETIERKDLAFFPIVMKLLQANYYIIFTF